MSGVSRHKRALGAWVLLLSLLVLALPRPAEPRETNGRSSTARPCPAPRCCRRDALRAPQPNVPYLAGYDGDELKGWVVLSTDVVDIKAYSGKPLITLVANHPRRRDQRRAGHPPQRAHPPGGHPSRDSSTSRRATPASTPPRRSWWANRPTRTPSPSTSSPAPPSRYWRRTRPSSTAPAPGLGGGRREGRGSGPRATSWRRRSRSAGNRWSTPASRPPHRTMRRWGCPTPTGASSICTSPSRRAQVGIALLGKPRVRLAHGPARPASTSWWCWATAPAPSRARASSRRDSSTRAVEQGLRSLLFTETELLPIAGAEADGAPSFKEGARSSSPRPTSSIRSAFDLVFWAAATTQRAVSAASSSGIKHTHTVCPRASICSTARTPARPSWRQAWYNKPLPGRDRGAVSGHRRRLFASRR